jgi:hypothetical protein
MKVEILRDSAATAHQAAKVIAASAREGVDRSFPAGRIRQENAVVLADRAAASAL